jgi:ferric-dicitrate binding protein FerR (iron transport regulator)
MKTSSLPPPARRATGARRRPSRRFAGALAAAVAAAALAGCANMEFGIANLQYGAPGGGRATDFYDPNSRVNIWNVL